MYITFSTISLVSILTLTLFLSSLSFFVWVIQRKDPMPLWLTVWLGASAAFALFRLLQYAPLSERNHIFLSRFALSAVFLIAWLGYEFVNSFIQYHPHHWERVIFSLGVGIPIIFIWTTDLILTDQLVTRNIALGGTFRGVSTGLLYIPAGIMVLVLSLISPVRLFRTSTAPREEARLLGVSFLIVLLFGLIDAFSTSLNLAWIRLSDYSAIPLSILFSYIQAQRLAIIYRKVNELVRERTAEIEQANEDLRSSEERYRLTLDNMLEGCQIIDYDWNYIYVNQTAAKHGQQTREEILNRSMMEIYPGIKDTEMFKALCQCMENRVPHHMESEFVFPDGSSRWFELSLQPVPEGVFILSIDVTERKQAEENMLRHTREMTTLYETTHDLVVDQDLDRVLHIIVERAAGLLEASGGGMYLCEPELQQVRCVVSYNTLEDYTGTVLKYGEGAAGYVAQTGESLIIDDYSAWEGRAEVFDAEKPFNRVLSVPMRGQDVLLGVIHVLGAIDRQPFNEEDLTTLSSFANQAVIAVHNAHLLASEQRRRREAAAIAEVSRDISSSLELDVVLDRIAMHAQELLEAETSAVYLYGLSKVTMNAVAATGPDAEEIKQDPLRVGEGILGNIALQETGEIVNNTLEDPRAITIKGTEDVLNEHLMGAPVLIDNQLTGLIAVWRIGQGQEFIPSDLAFLDNLAQQVAVAIKNARLFTIEQNRRREAETLREAAERITVTLDQEQAIRLILEQLGKVVHFESASIQLLREDYLEIVGGFGWSKPSEVIGLRFPVPGDNPNSTVVLERHAVNLSNATEAYPTFKQPLHGNIQSWLGVPLIVRDQVIGMFAVDHSQPDLFKENDIQMVTAFASQAAIAIENTRLFEETRRQLREMEGLAQVSATLSHTLELEPLLENVLFSATNAIPAAERGSILLADEKGNLHIRAVWGYEDLRVRNFVFPPNAGYASVAFQESRPVMIPDVRAEPTITYEGDIPEMLMGGSAIAAPLIVRDHAIGVIAVDTPARQGAFNERDLRLLEAMATPAALTIENARLFEDTRRRLAGLEILQTLASALRVAGNLDEAMPIILNQLINLLDVGSALIDLLDPNTNEIVTVLAHGVWTPVTGLRTPANVGVSGHVMTTGQPYTTTDVLGDGLIAGTTLVGGLTTVACVPIVAEGQPIGTLWVGRQNQEPIAEEEINVLIAVGEMVGNTIQRMELHEKTVQHAEEISAAYDLTLMGWAKALELRDKETEGHSRRVEDMALRLARHMGIAGDELEHFRRGVLLHDIGKMGIHDQLLRKTEPLTEDDWIELQKHPQYAYDMLYPITYLRPALDIPYCHHEKWDGSGYPRGLKGEEIPLTARIFAVIDVWEALSSDRTYRDAWTEEDSLSYIKEHAGSHFDPMVVEAFFQLLETEV